jgi:hypothetical protein
MYEGGFKSGIIRHLNGILYRKKRWVGKETVLDLQPGTVAIEGYRQFERVVSL